jgi:hypothetical protein
MGRARAGRRFLLRPNRPITFGPSSIYKIPINDNFANAITLSGTSISGTLDNSTIEIGEPFVGPYWNRSVWYKWVPTSGYGNSARFWIEPTLGYAFANIYTGTAVDDLTPVFSIDIVAETEYYIQVIFNYNAIYSPSANFTLHYSDPDVIQPSGPANDDYTGAISLPENSTVSGNNYYASSAVNEEGSYGVWYTFTVDTPDVVPHFIVTSPDEYSVKDWSILDESFQYLPYWEMQYGQTYYVIVYDYQYFPNSEQTGDFDLTSEYYQRASSSLAPEVTLNAQASILPAIRASLNTEFNISADINKKPYPRASLVTKIVFISDGEDDTVVRVNATANNTVKLEVSSKAFNTVSYTPSFKDINQIRTLTSVKLTFPDPAIINGKPYSPDYWSHLEGIYSATANNSGTITVVEDPVIPPFDPGSDRPGQQAYVWKASDLSVTNKLSKWPAHSGGPAWNSSRGYEPSVKSRVTFGSNGKYHTQSKGVLFDYHDVEHMWLRLPQAKSDDFTWMICGIILSYPTARYGHYVLDHGYNTKGFKTLPKTEATAKNLNESGYRAAMLYQRHSALMGSHTGSDLAANGKHVRIENNYLTKPRVMYSIWNNGASNNKGTIGTIGRRYHKSKTGTIDNKTMRDFVIGRRFDKVSQALASHMVIFEIRYFPRALGRTEIRRNANNLASIYKFGRY